MDRSGKDQGSKLGLSDLARGVDFFLLTVWVAAHLSCFIHVCETGHVRSAFQGGDSVQEGQCWEPWWCSS